MKIINPYRFGKNVLYRINCGGLEVTDDGFGNPIPSSEPTWERDSSTVPSQFLVNEVNSPTQVTNFSEALPYAKDSSVPDYVPLEIFRSQRYQNGGSQVPLRVYYKFPDTGTIPNGTYTVNVFFAHDYGFTGFTRDMDIVIEGVNLFNYTESGSPTYVCIMKTFNVLITDGVLDLEFQGQGKAHGIEILSN